MSDFAFLGGTFQQSPNPLGGKTLFFKTEVNQDISEHQNLKLNLENELMPQTGKAVRFELKSLLFNVVEVVFTSFLLLLLLSLSLMRLCSYRLGCI
jgi:hypothetical protein